MFQWRVYQRGEVWVWTYLLHRLTLKINCQFSEKSYGDLDPVASRAARTSAIAFIEIIKRLLSPISGYGKKCVNRNRSFGMLFINVIYTTQTFRIIFHFKVIVIVACMTLKQWFEDSDFSNLLYKWKYHFQYKTWI